MLRNELKNLVDAAVSRLIESGKLPEVAREVPVEVSDTKNPEHGDYALNFAMVATKRVGIPPRAIGEMLASELLGAQLVGVDLAGPGFINLRLDPAYIASFVGEALDKGTEFAKLTPDSPLKINVEFVSVNPNGPITVGSGRGAAFGSTLCNVLSAAGNEVHREYYINDGVNSEQMRQFAASVQALALGLPVPEKGYRGEYVKDVADVMVAMLADDLTPQIEYCQKVRGADPKDDIDLARMQVVLKRHLDSLERVAALKSQAQDTKSLIETMDVNDIKLQCELLMTERQSSDLKTFGVTFDTWFSEQSLHDQGEVARCIEALTTKGVADEEPYRTVLKMGKNGKIESVTREDQPVEEDEEDDETDSPSHPLTDSPTHASTLWLRSTKFGDDMDRVLRRKDGRLTYIASDVAYHADKFNRPPNADKLITILGPDHHGYIGRLQAVLAALLDASGEPRTTNDELSETEAIIYRSVQERDASQAALAEAKRKLEVVIFQIVRFVKDGKPAPMRKRDGNIYELRDLIDELGKNIAPNASLEEQRRLGADVSRFFYLMRSHDSHMDFDIDLATKQSDENPVFYAQYAYARICSVIRKAENASGQPDLSLLTNPRETALIKKILDLPAEIERISRDYGVHRLTTYAVELGRAFHGFYDVCRVIQPDQPELTTARLALCRAAQTALKATFDLLGVSAPERMEREARDLPEA